MPVMIQLRNVPDDLHKKLKARAAEAGMSLSDYILKDAQKLAERPTMAEWQKKLRKLEPILTKETAAEAIRAIRGK
jgi:plasmid stability protein